MKMFLLTASLLLAFTSPAQAVYPEDYMNKLSEDERSAYLFGALEMAMSVYDSVDRSDISDCLKDWWINHLEDANHVFWEKMQTPAATEYSAAATLNVVIRKHCDVKPQDGATSSTE